MNANRVLQCICLASMAVLIQGCGGGAASTPRVAASSTAACTSAPACSRTGSPGEEGYSSLVSFGDSLSDVGTYAVGSVVALGGGGKFTINAPQARIWVEALADELDLPAPCAYETGLIGASTPLNFDVPPTYHRGCTAYGQGGARVTDPVGIGNPAGPGPRGFLTVPVLTQIQNHLKVVGGRFSGHELVSVLAGANDALFQLFAVGSGTETAEQGVTAVGVAGAELAGYVKQLIVANGATRVIVVNLPDLSQTPFIVGLDAAQPGTQALASAMVQTFNAQLAAGLSGSGVLLVDAYSQSRAQNANPRTYGLTNTTLPACNLDAPTNPMKSALMCNDGNLQPGLSPAAAVTYEFSDDLHPTPYAHRLLAKLLLKAMEDKGRL